MKPESASRQLILSASLGSGHRQDLADDLASLDRAASGAVVLRVYSWDSPAVVLGYNQPLDDVNLLFCQERGIEVVRRASGGRGVIHHNDLGVSLALPMSHSWAAGIRTLYHAFSGAIANALSSLGYPVTGLRGEQCGRDSPVCFEHHGLDGLYLEERRVFGSAQVRRQHAVMIHGTLLLGFDADLHFSVFGVPSARLLERITSLDAAHRRDRIAEAVIESLSSHLAHAKISAPRQPRGSLLPSAAATTDKGAVYATNNHL